MTTSSEEAAQLLSYFEQLSNWGRWGDGDQLGTLNHITPAATTRAARLARTGRTVSCAWDIDPEIEVADGRSPQRFMVRSGEGLLDPNRVPPRYQEPGGRGGSAIEYIGLIFHGDGITHLDAPAHMFWDNQAYNGVPAARVSSEFGATTLSVTGSRDGIITRGVLLDLPAVSGLESLPPGSAITPDQLKEAERVQKVRVGEGDAVLLRTGHDHLQRTTGKARANTGPRSGWHQSCLPWLRERAVALVGSDTINDPLPPPCAAVPLPVHYIGIVAMGLWVLDNCDLEALARVCADEQRYEFMFTVAPLRLTGGTGSPVNPLATF